MQKCVHDAELLLIPRISKSRIGIRFQILRSSPGGHSLTHWALLFSAPLDSISVPVNVLIQTKDYTNIILTSTSKSLCFIIKLLWELLLWSCLAPTAHIRHWQEILGFRFRLSCPSQIWIHGLQWLQDQETKLASRLLDCTYPGIYTFHTVLDSLSSSATIRTGYMDLNTSWTDSTPDSGSINVTYLWIYISTILTSFLALRSDTLLHVNIALCISSLSSDILDILYSSLHGMKRCTLIGL